jgi:hypothetical protein
VKGETPYDISIASCVGYVEGENKEAAKETRSSLGMSTQQVFNEQPLDCLSAKEKQRILETARRDAKMIFEENRDATLLQLPDRVKRMFGQIGFAKWCRAFVPALVVSPYDVPPGAVRDEWLDAFEKVRAASNGLLAFGATPGRSLC